MIAPIMEQDSSNIASPPFKPWPTVGYGMAAYIGSAVLSIWVLGFLSMIFVNEGADLALIAEGEVTPATAHYFLRLICITAVVGSAMIYYITRARLGAGADAYLGLHKVTWPQMRPWMALSLVFVFVGSAITYVFDMWLEPTPLIDPLSMMDPGILLVVTIVVAVPMWEELLFRGFIFPA